MRREGGREGGREERREGEWKIRNKVREGGRKGGKKEEKVKKKRKYIEEERTWYRMIRFPLIDSMSWGLLFVSLSPCPS